MSAYQQPLRQPRRKPGAIPPAGSIPRRVRPSPGGFRPGKLVDAEAFNMLRKVNNQVKAQVAFDPKLKERFTTVAEYFANAKRKAPMPEEV